MRAVPDGQHKVNSIRRSVFGGVAIYEKYMELMGFLCSLEKANNSASPKPAGRKNPPDFSSGCSKMQKPMQIPRAWIRAT